MSQPRKNTTQADLDTIKQAMIGVIDNVNDVLAKAPKTISGVLDKFSQLNVLVEKFGTYAVMLNTKNPESKELGERFKQALENRIIPLLQINQENKEKLQRVQKGLNDLKTEIKNTGPGRTGRSM